MILKVTEDDYDGADGYWELPKGMTSPMLQKRFWDWFDRQDQKKVDSLYGGDRVFAQFLNESYPRLEPDLDWDEPNFYQKIEDTLDMKRTPSPKVETNSMMTHLDDAIRHQLAEGLNGMMKSTIKNIAQAEVSAFFPTHGRDWHVTHPLSVTDLNKAMANFKSAYELSALGLVPINVTHYQEEIAKDVR